jgi:hypothetical protein
MAQQGFRSVAGNPFIYQENDAATSVAMGIRGTDEVWKLVVSATAGSAPTGTAKIQVDPAVNGPITLSPDGTGYVVISNLTEGAALLSTTGEISSSGAGVLGQLLVSQGAGNSPAWQNNTASYSATDTTNFNNLLSSANTNVQSALDTLDDIFINTASATTSPQILFKKSRGAAALTSGDLTGTIKFSGYEGTSYIDSARITSTSSGTIALNRVAGDLKFYTHPDSAAADPTLRMTIAETGAVTIATPDSGTGLTVSGGGITATSGAITATSGNVVISAGNLTLPTTSSTVGQIQINSERVFHTYGTNNLFVGRSAGNFTTSGVGRSIGIGVGALSAVSTSTDNVALGYYAGNAITSQTSSIYIGSYVGQVNAGTGNNIAIGANALSLLSNNGNSGGYLIIGNNAVKYISQNSQGGVFIGHNVASNLIGNHRGNVIIGNNAAANLVGVGYPWTSALANIIIGINAGSAYTSTESSNIVIGNAGIVSTSNKILIGKQGSGEGQQNACHIAGIYNTAVGATAGVVLSDSNHQLGGIAGGAGTVLVGGTKPSFSSAVVLAAGGSLDTSTSAGNTLLIRAYDVDGTTYKTFATLTANDTPTMDLDTDVTIGTKYIYRADGTDVPVTDGGTGASTLTDHGILLGSGTSAITATAEPSNGQLLIGSTGNDPVLATLTAGTGISVTNGAGTISIAATGTILAWSEITGTTKTIVNQEAYVANNASRVVFTLPASAALGTEFKVQGYGSGGWKISQGSGQILRIGSGASTTGASGYAESTNRYDAVSFVCVVADTEWSATSVIGNITLA